MKVKTAYLLRIAFIFLIGCQVAKAQDDEKSLSKVDADVAKVKLNLTYEYQFMSKDSSEGIEKSFKNGKPHTEIYFKDRGQFQFVKVFNPKTGNLLKSDTILNFKKRVGSSITYFPSGKIKEIEHRDTSGEVDGYRGFFENGSKRISIGYKGGKRNGMFTEYNANGTLKETGPYVNDQRDGTFKFYDVRGALLATKKFKQGKIVK
jgi:antitoxin component YwqK of YwqJK toxin-antitoxin module